MDSTLPAVQRLATPQWIAGRAQTLLAHYFQPDMPPEVQEAAIADWIATLDGYSQAQIEGACKHYLQSQPRVRPTPGEIRNRIQSAPSKQVPAGKGDMNKLTTDQRQTLAGVLDRARRWRDTYPEGTNMHDHGKKTLDYWGQE